MAKLEVFEALTKVVKDHESDVAYAQDVVTALKQKLEEAQATLATEKEVHAELVKTAKSFDPNSAHKLLEIAKRHKEYREGEVIFKGGISIIDADEE